MKTKDDFFSQAKKYFTGKAKNEENLDSMDPEDYATEALLINPMLGAEANYAATEHAEKLD